MCEICQHTPCLPGCPNYVPDCEICDDCGCEILVGDYYVWDDETGRLLCEECAENQIAEYEEMISALRSNKKELTRRRLRDHDL